MFSCLNLGMIIDWSFQTWTLQIQKTIDCYLLIGWTRCGGQTPSSRMPNKLSSKKWQSLIITFGSTLTRRFSTWPSESVLDVMYRSWAGTEHILCHILNDRCSQFPYSLSLSLSKEQIDIMTVLSGNQSSNTWSWLTILKLPSLLFRHERRAIESYINEL